MKKKGVKDATVSEGWRALFRCWHFRLSLRTPEEVSCDRSIDTNPEIISKYFDLQKNTVVENDLVDQPCRIQYGRNGDAT